MQSNSEINLLVDTMIVEALLSDGRLSKTAQAEGAGAALIGKIKNYVSNQIDPNDKAGSVLNILAPGAIALAFKAMGLGMFGTFLGFAMRIFNIDTKGILTSIYEKIKSLITGNKPVSSAQVDGIVASAVQEHTKPATEEEMANAEKVLKTSQLLRDAKLLNLAMRHEAMTKEAASPFSLFSSRKLFTGSFLTRVLSLVFKVALASAGLMVAGDVANKFLGRPNALDGTVQNGKPVAPQSPSAYTPAVSHSTQTRFPANPSYRDEQKNGSDPWIEGIPNNELSIESMLVDWAKEVYQGLNGLEANLRASPALQVIKNRIAAYNRITQGQDNYVFIPKYFTSKKQVVDFFIDDVAESAPATPTAPAAQKA